MEQAVFFIEYTCTCKHRCSFLLFFIDYNYAMYGQTFLGSKISVAQCNLCIIIRVTLGICKHRGYAEMTLYSVYLK